MSRYDAFKPDDLKLVYRALHAHLAEHLELMDSDFFEGLQSHLQGLARAEGVDVTDHSRWDRWLGQETPPCSERVAGRRLLHLVRDGDTE